MCYFSYIDPWTVRNNNFSCKKSFVICGMKLVTSQQFHSHLTKSMQNSNTIPGPHISMKTTKLFNCLHVFLFLLPFHSSLTHKYIIRGKWYIPELIKLFLGEGARQFQQNMVCTRATRNSIRRIKIG